MTEKQLPFAITTPRLILRPPVMADVADIQAAKEGIRNDLRKWMGWATPENLSLEGTKNWIAREYDARNISLIARCRETGKFVASTGIHPPSTLPAGFDYPAYSTGYWVAKEFQGKGMATEATAAVILYAFNVLAAPSIAIQYFEGNAPSLRVIEKLGFTFLTTVQGAHRDYLDGDLLDEHHFVMHSPLVLPKISISCG
jgi:RimJ/RimL family protein N-acetyltransferase